MPIELSMYHQHDSTLSQFSTLNTHTHSQNQRKTHQFLSLFTFHLFRFSKHSHRPTHLRVFGTLLWSISLSLSLCLWLFPIYLSLSLTLSVSFNSFSLCSLISIEVKALQAVLRTQFRPTSLSFLSFTFHSFPRQTDALL